MPSSAGIPIPTVQPSHGGLMLPQFLLYLIYLSYVMYVYQIEHRLLHFPQCCECCDEFGGKGDVTALSHALVLIQDALFTLNEDDVWEKRDDPYF